MCTLIFVLTLSLLKFFYHNTSLTVLKYMCQQFYFWIIVAQLFLAFLFDLFVELDTVRDAELPGLSMRRAIQCWVFITTLGVVVLIDAAKCTTRRFMFVYLILVYANLVYAMVSVYIKGANMDELAMGLNLRRMKQWLYLGVFTHFTQIVLHVIFDKKEETFAIIKNGRYRSEVQKMEKQRKLDKAQKRRQLKSIDVSKIFNTHVRATGADA